MKRTLRSNILKFGAKKKLGLKRCLVPEGPFMMGTRGDTFDESPAHRVYVSAFEMGQTPVLNSDYGIFLKENKDVDPPQSWDEPTTRSNPSAASIGTRPRSTAPGWGRRSA
jgi:formylglycine-generating enzyme required for sulfatase activity